VTEIDEANLVRELVGPRCFYCDQLIIRASRGSMDWHHIEQPADHQARPPERILE